MNKRTEFVEKLSAEMVEWDVQIELLKERAENADPQVKYEFSNTLAVLQRKRDEAAMKLQGISAASDDEWEEIKTGTEHIWGEISNSLRDAILKTK